MKTKDKEIYLEVIRILAILGVVFNHTCGFYSFERTDSIVLYLLAIYSSILCKMAVPLFFMISGYLLLGKEETLKEVLVKRVLRYCVVILVATSMIHVFTDIYRGKNAFSARTVFKMIYRGDVLTYWFLYAYLGILLMLPFLRGCVQYLVKENVIYLVGLRIFVGGILPIVSCLGLGYLMQTKIDSPILLQSVFYFLIGYYFGNIENPFEMRKKRIVAFLISFLTLNISSFMIYYEYISIGEYTDNFLEGLLPIICITVFLAARYYSRAISVEGKIWKAIAFAGDKVFGIYLIESLLRMYGETLPILLTNRLPEYVAGIICCVLYVLVGMIIISILKCIPFVRKII